MWTPTWPSLADAVGRRSCNARPMTRGAQSAASVSCARHSSVAAGRLRRSRPARPQSSDVGSPAAAPSPPARAARRPRLPAGLGARRDRRGDRLAPGCRRRRPGRARVRPQLRGRARRPSRSRPWTAASASRPCSMNQARSASIVDSAYRSQTRSSSARTPASAHASIAATNASSTRPVDVRAGQRAARGPATR